MKRLTRRVCLLLCMVMLLTTPAFAAESIMPRGSNFFIRSSVYLDVTSGTTFDAWFSVDAVNIMDQLGASTITIQRSHDGQTWISMRTFTKEEYPHLIRENAGTYANYVTYKGTVGYYYRACVKLYAKNSTGIGQVTEYTSVLHLT